MPTETQAHEVRMERFKARLVKRGFTEAAAEDEARQWVFAKSEPAKTTQS